MSKLIKQIAKKEIIDQKGRFEKFNLIENPFPSEPVVNKDSNDKRINGNIFEFEIRRKEYDQILINFLKQPLNNPNHIRIGLLRDSSYIGRGNGKSAFLINLQQNINKDYCLDISNNINKCFAIYLSPEPGGRTKTFYNFVDSVALSIFDSNIIDESLAILRLGAISEINPGLNVKKEFSSDEEIVSKLNSENWYEKKKISLIDINDKILNNTFLQELPPQFPLFQMPNMFTPDLVSKKNFKEYYNGLKKGKERLDFIFTHLIRLFLAAGFNGAFLLVDDFERIPDFQSSRQKKDFSLELRSCIYDGMYLNSRIGFYNLFLVFHAGVQRLISEAWAESGMENRVPISPSIASKHIIIFDKLSEQHAKLLLKKYLDEYRINKSMKNELFPFTIEAVGKMGELSEYNASKILKLAFNLLDKAADDSKQKQIDLKFVMLNKESFELSQDKTIPSIEETHSVDLQKKAKGKKK